MDIRIWNREIKPAEVGFSGDGYPEGSMAVMINWFNIILLFKFEIFRTIRSGDIP